MKLVKDDDPILIIGHRPINLYHILKGTKYSLYVPYLSILVEDRIINAVIMFLKSDGYANMRLEEYLSRMVD